MKELHVRECPKRKEKSIVAIACGFHSEIIAVVNDERYNAKSIMNSPIVDSAKCVDFIITGEDEEVAEIAIKPQYGLD